ncbi:MAG: ADP-ribosylglycohydrolase family protein [Terrimicrobiaceae bacterium]|nr:ADP-ribosylglycohydrolase family protein [Terrimicrobiaceae bacterium]
MKTTEDRVQGALLGALIGEALGVGPHWYYDIDELRREHGEWIRDYTRPKAGRYHEGLRPGEPSQAGIILRMLMESLAEKGTYDEADFCRRLEEDLFPRLDGKPFSGPGGYTSQSIREVWRNRVLHNLPWTNAGGPADTTEAIERTLALAARYWKHPALLARTTNDNAALTQTDGTVLSMTVAFSAVLGLLIEGHPFNPEISDTLMRRVKTGELPFHAATTGNLQPPKPGDPDPPRAGRFASPDALLTPSYMAEAAGDPGIRIEPAWKVSIVYGMPCAVYHQLPAAYYLAARFPDDFESAVLHAINGGGQNMARAMLVGALTGAQTGLSGIPARFIEGLMDSGALVQLAGKIATDSMR